MTTTNISTSVSIVTRSPAESGFTKAAAVQPSARGKFLRACQGEILVMLAHYGWIMSSDNIDHADDDKKTSQHIYVHKNDVVNGESLMQGDLVTFNLYSDNGTLRAESCELRQHALTCRSSKGQHEGFAPSSDNESDGSSSRSVHTLSEDVSTSASIADYDSCNDSVPAESEPDAVPWGNVASKIGSKLADLSDSDSDSASTGAPATSEPDVMPWANVASKLGTKLRALSDLDSANEAAPAESEPDVVPWGNVASKIGSKLADLSDSDSASHKTPSDSETDVVPWGQVANRLSAKLGAISDTGSDSEAVPTASEAVAIRWGKVASTFSSQLATPSDSDSASQGAPSDSEAAVLPWSNVASRLGSKLGALSDDEVANEAALILREPDVVPWGNVASRLGAKLSAMTEEVVTFPQWPNNANDFTIRSVCLHSEAESAGAKLANIDDVSGTDADTESYDGDTESYDGDKDSFDGNHEKNDSDDESVHSAFDVSRSHIEDIEWDSDIGEVLPAWHKRGIAYLALLEERNERCQNDVVIHDIVDDTNRHKDDIEWDSDIGEALPSWHSRGIAYLASLEERNARCQADVVMKTSLKSPAASSDKSTSIGERSDSSRSLHSSSDQTASHKDDIEWDSEVGEALPVWHKRGIAYLASLKERQGLTAPPGLNVPQGLIPLPPGLAIQCNEPHQSQPSVDVDTLCKECNTPGLHIWGCSAHRTYTSALLLMHRHRHTQV